MKEITFTDTFDSAHRLLNYKGACHNLHGHTYQVFVSIVGDIVDGKFVIDYNDIKAVLRKFDHKTLVWKEDKELLKLAEDMNGADGVHITESETTAENLAEEIAKALLDKGVFERVTVELKETTKSSAICCLEASE